MVVGSVSLAELITGQHVPEGSAPSHFNRSTRIEKCPAWRWWDSVPTMAGLIRIILRERLRPALEPINHGSSRFGTTNHFARLGIAPKRLGAGTILRAVTWPKGAYEPLQLVTVPILSANPLGVILRHSQNFTAAAGLLPAIATGAATTATINVKRSNRIVASHVALLLQSPTSCHRNLYVPSGRIARVPCRYTRHTFSHSDMAKVMSTPMKLVMSAAPLSLSNVVRSVIARDRQYGFAGLHLRS